MVCSNHNPVQHRDGAEPWCDVCGKNRAGEEPTSIFDGLKKDQDELSFEAELSSLLNRNSKESDSGTPDYILASFLIGCLDIWNNTVQERARHRDEPINNIPRL